MSAGRLLLVRTGAMGDVLHALPAVTALRAGDFRAEDRQLAIDWVVDPRWAPLLVKDTGTGPVVSRVHLAETRLWSRAPFSAATVRSVMTLRSALNAGRYHQVVDLQGTTRSAVIGRMAGSESLAGFADPREFPARLLYRRTFDRRGTHVAQQNTSLLAEALGMSLSPAEVVLPIAPEAEDWAECCLRDAGLQGRVALLAPSAGWRAKQWPAKNFGLLAKALHAMGFGVLVNAPPVLDSVAAEVLRVSEGAATAATCNLAQLIALTRRAAVVVGGDSGPVHLAAALGCPLVALYGPTDPARNGPWGPGRMRVLRHPSSVTSYRHTSEVDSGLARIEVDEVVEGVHELVS